MARFTTYLKNILLIAILIQLVPPLVRNLQQYYMGLSQVKTKVGVLRIKGMITEGEPYLTFLRSYFKDPSIKAIVLKIDSPGGASGAAQALFQEINDLKQDNVKTVIAFSENACTSAAYYVACAADYIITQPSTLVGSIGVYIGYPNFEEFLNQIKIRYNTIETGAYKAGSLFFKDLTPDQRAMFQSLTDETYAQFVRDVAQRRPKVASLDTKKWADGKTFTGSQALKLGLVDELGSQATLIRVLRAKAPIEGEILWVFPPQQSTISKIFGMMSSTEANTEEVHTQARVYGALRAMVDFFTAPLQV